VETTLLQYPKTHLTDFGLGSQIFINLCGKNNVRNCDLLQKMRPQNVVIFTLEKHATKSHLPKLILRAVEATSAALIECLGSRTQSRDFLSV